MENLILALFDSPLYIHRSTQTSPASRSSSNTLALVPFNASFCETQLPVSLSEHTMRPDASTFEALNTSNLQVEQHPASESRSVSSLNSAELSVPNTSLASGTPSNTVQMGNASKPMASAFQSSKPFIPRSYGGDLAPLSSGPVFPSTRIHPVKSVSVAFPDGSSNRAFSLPVRFVPGTDASLDQSATTLTPAYGNRIVSLPESTTFPNKLIVSSLPSSHHPRDDDTRPLIDLSSPQPKHITLSSAQSSPNGSILIHSSFDKSSSRSPSPSSTHEYSQSESESIIFVNNPLIGRSPSFLRRPQSPASRVVEDAPSPAKARLVKLTSSQSAQQGWIPVSPPRPIPALHGPPSLPYARCPSGAEGVMISEQSSLPRMIWGLDEQSLLAPKTPHLQSSAHDTLVSTGGSDTNSSNAYTPASTMLNTPASTLAPSTNASTPASTASVQYKPVSDRASDHSEHHGFDKAARHSAVTSKGESQQLGSPLELATPGGYTEYHYVESTQWQEFVPQPRIDPSTHSESLLGVPSVHVSSTGAAIAGPVQRSHSQSRPIAAVRNDEQHSSHQPGALIPPIYTHRRPATFSVPQQPLRPKLRDLTQITDLISNADMAALTVPELWSASLRQFWNGAFAQLGPTATAFAATLRPPPPLYPPGISIPSPAVQRSDPAPSSRRSSGDSDVNSTDKHEPYVGALDNPRSVPIARLRRKLATVAEEKNIEGSRQSTVEQKETSSTPVLSLEAETQNAFGGVTEEGLRVRLPHRSGAAPANSADLPVTRAVASKANSADAKRRNMGRRSGPSTSSTAPRPHLLASNALSKDLTKEVRRSLSSSINNSNSGSKQTRRQPKPVSVTH